MLRWKDRALKLRRLFKSDSIEQEKDYCEYINPHVAGTVNRIQQQAAYVIERTLDEMYNHQAGMSFSKIEADKEQPNIIKVSFEGTEHYPYSVDLTCPAWMKDLKQEASNRLRR
jgi:hypothetical protein